MAKYKVKVAQTMVVQTAELLIEAKNGPEAQEKAIEMAMERDDIEWNEGEGSVQDENDLEVIEIRSVCPICYGDLMVGKTETDPCTCEKHGTVEVERPKELPIEAVKRTAELRGFSIGYDNDGQMILYTGVIDEKHKQD